MSKTRKSLLFSGIILIAAAIAVWVFTDVVSQFRFKNADYYVEKLYSVMPELTEGIPEERSDSVIAAYEVDGLNFAGIIEMPDYTLKLPIYGEWDTTKLRTFPCLFSGSANNSNLILGSTSDKDLFDFVKQISVDDRIVFTDMTGVQFTYYITNIRHTKSADRDTLVKESGDFILFIKDRTAFDYVIINASCSTDNIV